MSEHIQTAVKNRIGLLILDRPKALNSLSLDMVRALTQTLLAWRSDDEVCAVFIRSASERAFCAGGDIRFFYEAGSKTPQGGSALMDGVVMGGGMGIAQAGASNRMRIVTERTRMAMPEVNIGMFPDVGGSFFLSRAPGEIGTYLGVTGETIAVADALYAGLADVFVPSDRVPDLIDFIMSFEGSDIRAAIRDFAMSFHMQADPAGGSLAAQRTAIDRHFAHDDVGVIVSSLKQDASPFAGETLAAMGKRSPLMMCVTLSQLRRGANMSIADCLRMERTMVRRCLEHGEVLEGVRALAIDKDNAPRWNPARLEDVSAEAIASFFEPVWPAYAHPLRNPINV